MQAGYSSAQLATKDGPETTWSHWLQTAPDLPYDTTPRSQSQGSDVKGIVGSLLRALLHAKEEKDDADDSSVHAFVRLRPTLEQANLAPTQLVEALEYEALGDIHAHWNDVSFGRTGDRWRANAAQTENAIEARYLGTYVRAMSALADSAAMQSLGTANLCLVSQQAVQYRHYDGTMHTAFADAVNVGADGMEGRFSGPPHEFKHDAAFTSQHVAAVDGVHELNLIAVEPQIEPRRPLQTVVLASPAQRDRDKVDFYFTTAAGTLGERVGTTLATALAQLLQGPSYACAGFTRRASIGNAQRWIATENGYNAEPFVEWARSLGNPAGLDAEEDLPEQDEVDEEEQAILLPWDAMLAALPPLQASPASHFAFLAGSTYTHLTGAVRPPSEWPLATDAVDPTPRKARRARFGLRQEEAD